ncbi:MAG: hypothetical protein OEY96_10085 [Gammaproteobacteria bacterium]|nr:hypothetical protein [Gammaproteobacteria bacterium]
MNTQTKNSMPLLQQSGYFYGVMLLLAFIAFWPNYLSKLSDNNFYAHIHGITGTMWILLLITQPLMIKNKRRDLHQMLGKISYILAPIVIVSFFMLAHHKISILPADHEFYPVQSYFLYLQVTLGSVFALCYIMGVLNRSNMAVHARYMICTGLTFVDPILARIIFAFNQSMTLTSYQLISFIIMDAIILFLIWMERNESKAKNVLPRILVVFLIVQIPLLMGFTQSSIWQGFTAWLAGI